MSKFTLQEGNQQDIFTVDKEYFMLPIDEKLEGLKLLSKFVETEMQKHNLNSKKGVTAEYPQGSRILFYINGETECGKLFKNDDNRLCFTGNVDESAYIFFKEICNIWNVTIPIYEC